MPTASVIICSLGRNAALYDVKESLYQQTNQDFEIVIVNEEGPLSKIRNIGAKKARGNFYLFIDDDVVCSPSWFQAVMDAFSRGYAGVSGPSYTTAEFRKNRDCFKLPTKLFSCKRPGRLSRWGMWSLAATSEDCSFDGEVDYLEACNMAFEKKAFWSVNGFDESYGGIGDWSEPDLCFRLRKAGFRMFFSRDARLEHRPSQSGAYKKRLKKCNRMENYELFSLRWIKPNIFHSIFKFVIRNYFKLKENQWI